MMKIKAKFCMLTVVCLMCVFSAAFALTAFAQSDYSLAAARESANENLVGRENTVIGNDYRSGYNDAASYNSGIITVTRPEGTDARVGFLLSNDAIGKTEVLKGGEIVSAASLSAYYSVEMIYGDYENQYGTYGLTVAKTVRGDSVTYHSYTLEQARGFVHYYTFTTNPVNESDDVPEVVSYDAVKVKGDTIKFEIIKEANNFGIYINGDYCFTRTIANATPIFGTMMFDTDVTYKNMTFKYLDENVDVDTVVSIPEKLKGARDKSGTFATGMGETSMTGNLRSPDTHVSFTDGTIVSDIECAGDWTNSANLLTDEYLDQATVKNAAGEQIPTSSTGALVTADVKYSAPALEYRKTGVLFGKRAEGDATRYFALVYEPGRGFVFVYSFVREAGGGVNAETEPAVYTATNLGFPAEKTLTFEIIVEAGGVSAYINNIEVAKNVASAEGLDLTDITPVVGAMFREMKGSVSNISLKYLEKVEFIFPVPPKLAAAQKGGVSVTEGKTLTMTGNLRDGGFNMITFENGEGNAVKDDNGRDVRMFGNKELRQEEAYINENIVATSELSVYYKANLTYKDRNNQYGSFGILIGRNKANNFTRYYSVVLEPFRGYVFLYWFDVKADGGAVAEGNINVMVSEDTGIKKDIEGKLEVIKEGNALSVYWNGKTVIENFTDDGFENVTPVFGLNTFDVSASYKNLEMKFLTADYSFYLPDTRPSLTTVNVLAGIDAVENGTATENGFVYPNDNEFSSMIANVRDYVYVYDGTYKRVDDATLNSYVQVKLKFGEFASPAQNWYGAGVIFRGTYEKGYAIRLLGNRALLMKNGEEVASTGIAAIEQGTEALVQVYSASDSFSAWINGEQIFEDYSLDTAMKCSLGIRVVYNAVEISDISMQYSVEVYDSNPNASGDDSLEYIKFDGELLEGFEPTKTEYSFNLGRGESMPETSQFKAKAAHEYASVEIRAEGNKIIVTVTAENSSVKTYVIEYIAERNSDSSLKALSIAGTTIALTESKINYEFTMPAHMRYPSSTEIIATPNDEYASAMVKVENGEAKITVTAENGTVTVYTVTIFLDLSSDAALSSVTVKGEAIKDFKPGIYAYNVKVAEAVTEEDIEFVCADEYANATMAFENGKAVITVTAEDGTTAVYAVTFEIGGGESSKDETSSGCFGSVSVSGLVFALTALAVVVLFKKKQN